MIDNRLFEKYDGLIFDMDGTLIDTMPVHARAWNLVGEQFGYRFNSQIMYDLGGATVSTIASAIMQDAGMPQERLNEVIQACLLYTSPSPRDVEESRMPSSA